MFGAKMSWREFRRIRTFYNGIYINGQDKNSRIGTSYTLMDYPKEPQVFMIFLIEKRGRLLGKKTKKKIPIQDNGI